MSKIDLPAERRVGHLRLLREARSITPKEFNSLTFTERLDIVRRAHGMQKYNLLIEASDSEALVRRMAAQEVYLLIKELGVEDSADLVPMATTGQFTTFIDLDCWDGDAMKGDKALEWIGLLLEGGEESVFETLYRLDFELLSLMFKKFITVVGGPEDIEEEDLRAQAMCRDGGYSIEYRDPEQEGKLVGGFLDVIFRNDVDFFRRIMDSGSRKRFSKRTSTGSGPVAWRNSVFPILSRRSWSTATSMPICWCSLSIARTAPFPATGWKPPAFT